MTQFLGGTDVMMGALFQTSLVGEFMRPYSLKASRSCNYHDRQIRAGKKKSKFLTRWPRGGFMNGDPTVPLSLIGGTVDSELAYGDWNAMARGSGSMKYIMGQCVDENGTPVPGAVVQGFRTSDDLFVREVACDDKGNYELGTEYPGVAHYLVAYLDTATDLAGTTVNTLTPTNRDGT